MRFILTKIMAQHLEEDTIYIFVIKQTKMDLHTVM